MPTESTISEIPLLDLNAQYQQIKGEVKDAVTRVLESQYFIMGPEVKRLEKQIADYCGTQYAIGCASGSDALLLSLMALDIGQGDAVITTSFTFFATAGSIARVGATPVFLDIDPLTYNIDPAQVQLFLAGDHPLNKTLAISPTDVKAIIPVHLYGQMADMNPLMDAADTYGIKVIEDAAQAIGSEYENKRAGSIGDLGCFSFFPSKNLGAYGDAGLITTDDKDLAEKLNILRLHGADPKYHHRLVGINSRLDALQAAILQVKLKYLEQWSAKRRQKALKYNALFKARDLAFPHEEYKHSEQPNLLKNKILTPCETTGDPQLNGRHIYHQYVIRTGARQQIIEAFKQRNIGYSIYYPVPMHEQKCFCYLGYEPSYCPVSSRASDTTLALPIYPEITDAQQEYVVNTIYKTIKHI